MINTLTQFGFTFGSADVKRLASDEKKGWVYLGVDTPKKEQCIHIYVTKTGIVRVYKQGKELV
jgi:hypothetical protein